jgi:NRPS condensation-like uncharacterized protein
MSIPASGRRFRAEVFDKLQFLFEECQYNDHHLHSVISFKGRLQPDLLKKAVSLSIEAVPLLGCRFVLETRNTYWEKLEIVQSEKTLEFMDSDHLERDLNALLISKTEALKGPQIKLTMLRGPGCDVLHIVMNHMVCDAAGFKDYLYLLGSIYSGLTKNPHYTPPHNSVGNRGIAQVFNQFKLIDRIRLLGLAPNTQNSQYRMNSGFTGKEKFHPCIRIHELPEATYRALKTYCRRHAVTVNDVMLAAYYRVLYRLFNLAETVHLNIPCTVDLRRYLPQPQAPAFCNLASWISCDIIPGEDEQFTDTVKRVHTIMESQKKSFPGLNGLASLSLISRIFAYSKTREIIRKRLQYPLFALTNIGIIDQNRLVFGDLSIQAAFMTGSIKYPPYFQMALSTFNDTITCSLNLSDSESDRELINRYFGLFDQELADNLDS